MVMFTVEKTLILQSSQPLRFPQIGLKKNTTMTVMSFCQNTPPRVARSHLLVTVPETLQTLNLVVIQDRWQYPTHIYKSHTCSTFGKSEMSSRNLRLQLKRLIMALLH